jgi:beta-xylosidase
MSGLRRQFGLIFILGSVLLFPGSALADDPPTYTNPVHPKDFPDPFVIAHDGRYYAYGTQTRGTGFQLMESPDLVHWKLRPLDFPVPWAKDHYWAPEVIRHNGEFFLTYSALDPKSKKHHIALATSKAPTGPFRHRAILVQGGDNKVGVIDATIFFEDNGSAFLVYSEETPRRIVMRRMRPDLLSVENEITALLHPDLDWERGVTEAPMVIKRNGVYHLFYSGGPYQGEKRKDSYAVGHASAPALKGPYQKTPKPLLETLEGKVYGPGHQCLVNTPDGRWWCLYHAWDAEGEPRYGKNPSGRTVRLDRLVWQGDVPRIVGPTVTPQPGP